MLVDKLAALRRRRLAYRWTMRLVWLGGWAVTAFLMLDPGLKPPGHMSDKTAHALLYAAITGMAAMLADRLDRFLPLLLFTWLVSAGFEGLQAWVPGRNVDAADLGANSVGILAGAVAGCLWLWLCRRLDGRAGALAG